MDRALQGGGKMNFVRLDAGVSGAGLDGCGLSIFLEWALFWRLFRIII